MPAPITALRIARGISRRGSFVSSPSAAAPSNPPQERNASTMARPSAELLVPPGSRKTSELKPALPGADPFAIFTKMTTISTVIRSTETASMLSSVRVVILMSL